MGVGGYSGTLDQFQTDRQVNRYIRYTINKQKERCLTNSQNDRLKDVWNTAD